MDTLVSQVEELNPDWFSLIWRDPKFLLKSGVRLSIDPLVLLVVILLIRAVFIWESFCPCWGPLWIQWDNTVILHRMADGPFLSCLLSFFVKTSLAVKLFIWKCVHTSGLFSCKLNWYSYETSCMRTHFETKAQGSFDMNHIAAGVWIIVCIMIT